VTYPHVLYASCVCVVDADTCTLVGFKPYLASFSALTLLVWSYDL